MINASREMEIYTVSADGHVCMLLMMLLLVAHIALCPKIKASTQHLQFGLQPPPSLPPRARVLSLLCSERYKKSWPSAYVVVIIRSFRSSSRRQRHHRISNTHATLFAVFLPSPFQCVSTTSPNKSCTTLPSPTILTVRYVPWAQRTPSRFGRSAAAACLEGRPAQDGPVYVYAATRLLHQSGDYQDRGRYPAPR